MAKDPRINFSHKTKKLLADRAGNRCSFPACQKTTSGPSKKSTNSATRIGQAAHIFSASPNGPRGHGNLNVSELESVQNGIWLCSDHAKLVDNNGGQDYSSATLLS